MNRALSQSSVSINRFAMLDFSGKENAGIFFVRFSLLAHCEKEAAHKNNEKILNLQVINPRLSRY